jgi:cysteinyl-tRNA synthetase
MNITDVGHLTSDADEGEDKLEKGARREGKTAWEVAEFYTDDFLGGMRRLNLLMPTHITKATDYIPQQLALVQTLKDRGFTYQISDGIYFDTAKFPTYAEFAGLDLAAQQAGARVEFNKEKRNASDFALWKFTPANEKRDMEWPTPPELLDSPEERYGFPGWHLECSAMAMAHLGDTIDIHTGGIDHIPVHHTNEIAQSEAASGKLFSRFWLHNNHLKVNGTKISKSLDNGYTLDDLQAKGYTPLDFRLFILQSHYRTEGNFTFENLDAAKNRLRNWRGFAALRHQIHDGIELKSDTIDTLLRDAIPALRSNIADDLNTPEVLRVIDEVFDVLAKQHIDRIPRPSLLLFLEEVDSLLGLQLLETTPDIDDEVKRLILEREQVREAKDWQKSDELRTHIEKNGIVVRDTAHGSVWEYSA